MSNIREYIESIMNIIPDLEDVYDKIEELRDELNEENASVGTPIDEALSYVEHAAEELEQIVSDLNYFTVLQDAKLTEGTSE